MSESKGQKGTEEGENWQLAVEGEEGEEEGEEGEEKKEKGEEEEDLIF